MNYSSDEEFCCIRIWRGDDSAMTLPSIKMTGSYTAGAGAPSLAWEAGQGPASFASFLDATDVSTVDRQSAPSAAGAPPQVAAEGLEKTKASIAGAVNADANAQISSRTPTETRRSSMRDNSKDRMAGIPVRTKASGGAKGQGSASEHISGDVLAGQALAASPVPAVISAEGETSFGARAEVTAGQFPVESSVETAAGGMSVGELAGAASDDVVRATEQGANEPKQDETELQVESNSMAECMGADGTASMIPNALQGPVPPASPEVAAALLQAAQPEAAGRSDRPQPMEMQEVGTMTSQKRANGLPTAADKTSIPAASSTTSSLVAGLSQGDANEHVFYMANGKINARPPVESERGIDSESPSVVSGSDISVEKSAARQGSTASHAPLPSASSINQHFEMGGVTSLETLGIASSSSKPFGAPSASDDLPQSASSAFSLSDSDQFTKERLQTAGTVRALGDALQSAMGVGVQTESFGRVTIHTATEGNHLLAQVTLEDGRQSATLVSHVPAVEQRLTQQFGLEAAVSVSTGSQSSLGGGANGDSGRDASPQRHQPTEAKPQNTAQGMTDERVAVEDRTSSPWAQSSSASRLDVTV